MLGTSEQAVFQDARRPHHAVHHSGQLDHCTADFACIFKSKPKQPKLDTHVCAKRSGYLFFPLRREMDGPEQNPKHLLTHHPCRASCTCHALLSAVFLHLRERSILARATLGLHRTFDFRRIPIDACRGA